MYSEEDLLKAIKAYGEAYKRLEEFQPESKPKKDSVDESAWLQCSKKALIPRGDQKSGCIGEFYARLYLKDAYKGCEVNFGGHSQEGWDIEVGTDIKKRFQVKTLTRYSKTNRVGKLKKGNGWNKLILVFLDYDFSLTGFYVFKPLGFNSFSDYPSPPHGESNDVFGKQLTFSFDWNDLKLNSVPKGFEDSENLIGQSQALKKFSKASRCKELNREWWDAREVYLKSY